MTRSSLPVEGELFDDKYRIGAVLGIGGMAAVIAAKHLGFDEMVALKVLLPDCNDDPAVVERFVQEGKTAIKIRSEHVVRMLDVGVFAGRAYLVMEHLDGKDLEALLRIEGPLPLPTAVDMLLQACEAIGEAHALGIIHRDLKPANLFLTHRADGSPCVKVLDFGISKMPRNVSGFRTDAHPTLPSVVMGSPQYMSPEQMMAARNADQRSDIWSLGAILYELLTARVAFEGCTTAEVCARVLQGAPTPLAQLQPGIHADIALIIARCHAKDPARRYANVAELARALAPFGTSSARASAESITRVVEGTKPRSPSLSGTIKPTAAEILAKGPAKRVGRARVSGYVLGASLAVLSLGVVAGGVARRVGVRHPAWAAAAAGPVMSPLPQPEPLVLPPSPAALPLPAPPLAAPHPVVAHRARPIGSSTALTPSAGGEGDAGLAEVF